MLLFISAFFLGLIFNAAPGAVFAETVRQGVRGGYRPALAVQIGSLVGDATWAILGLVGIGLLLQLDVLRIPVGIASVAYLCYLSWDAWQAANREFQVEAAAGSCEKRALRAGMVLSLSNPQNVAYWAALGSAMGAVGLNQPQPADYAIFFAGFMVSSILWSFVCAAGVALLFRNSGQRWATLTYRLCAAAFLLLALGALRDLMQPSSVTAQAASDRPPITGRP
jgi:chemosensory pili system protein ChpE